MSVKGYVLKERAYIGSATPPDTFEDEARRNHGVHTNVTWVRTPKGLWVRGFNGSSSRIELGNIKYSGLLAITIGGWLNFADVNRRNMIFSQDAQPFQLSQRGEAGANLLDLEINIDSSGYIFNQVSPTNYVNDTWVQVVFTHTLGTGAWAFFRDGIQNGNTGTQAGTAYTGSNDTFIGSHPGLGVFHEGNISLFRVYNYALSPEQIAAIFQNERHWFGV